MTVHLIVEDFRRRRSQVRRYIAVVLRAERETKLGSGSKVELDRLHVLRAGTFLILYNLVEASTRAAIQAILDAMVTRKVPFGELNRGIRREIVKGFKRNGDADLHADMRDLPVDLVAVALETKYYISGNVDARLIKEIAEIYSFSTITNKRKTHDGADLLTVKNRRNDLAHGDNSFTDVGRTFTGRELLEIGLRTMGYVEAILDNVVRYVTQEGYR